MGSWALLRSSSETLYDLFIGNIEVVMDPNKKVEVLMSDDRPTQTPTTLKFEVEALQYLRAPSIYLCDSREKRLCHKLQADWVVYYYYYYCGQKGLPGPKMLS